MAVMGSQDPRTASEPPEVEVDEGDTVHSRLNRRNTMQVERVGPLEIHLSKQGRVECAVDRRDFDQQYVRATSQ